MERVLQDKDWHNKEIDDISNLLEVDVNGGLDDSEVKLRQTRFGLNRVTSKKQEGPVMRFIKQFSQPLVYILLAAAIITAALQEWVDSAVIFGVVLVMSIVGFMQETKAGKAIEALAKMVTTEATVIRSKGKRARIPSFEIVPGDIVILRSGDKVPADIRLFSTRDLRIDESLLTGESVPVDKSSLQALSSDTAVADRKNMAFAGTMITYGQGTGIVVGTGDHTETGRISENIYAAQELVTPLSRKLAQFSKFLLYVVLGLAAVTFAFGFIQQQLDPVNLFMASVALAVAAIPEGLPAAVTITLSIGVNRLAKSHSIIRKLPAVETLGSTTAICSDKTGTLTENQMTVKEILSGGIRYYVEGSGYFPRGRFVIMQDNSRDIQSVINKLDHDSKKSNVKKEELIDDPVPVPDVAAHPVLEECLIAGLLCNESYLLEKDGKWEIKGDPTEGSLIVSARKAGLNETELYHRMQRIDMIPFESHLQYMATLHTLNKTIDGNSYNIIYVKGAIEKVLGKCRYVTVEEQKGVKEHKKYHKSLSIRQLTGIESDQLLNQAEYMAKRGFRVMAFARKETNKNKNTIETSDIDTDLAFLGLQGMIDPPRGDVIKSVAACKNAGINVKMITGDNLHTATFIARQLGLTDNGHTAAEKVIDDNNRANNSVAEKNREDNIATTDPGLITMTGEDIKNYYSDKRGEAKLAEVVEKTIVFARVSPDQKLLLVRALQSNGHIVAMTGDGVNDAPALKQADIGIAMGLTGTEVAKEASDMILTDDNFASIVAAVEEGRGIFDNLMKFLTWTLPTNFGEALILLAAIFSSLSLPMLPVQILWINMTTALALGMMLIFEPKEPYIMNRPPRPPSAPILNRTMVERIILASVIILVGVFGLYLWEERMGTSIEEARTVAVNAIVMIELFYLLNCRSLTRSMFSIGLFSNKWIIVGIALIVALQMMYTYLPIMNIIFESSPIRIDSWIMIIGLAFVSYLIIELDKSIRRRLCERKT